jgi:drug/metabolite transporter (DMT)-like permease
MINIYFPIFLILVIKSFRPFLRKQLLTSFTNDQYMLINSILILIIFIIYLIFQSKINIINTTYTTYNNLIIKDKLILIGLALMAVVTNLTLYKLDKMENQIESNIILKELSTIMTLLVGYYVYNKKLSKKQITGIIIICFGVYFITN